jgi:FkbM family methyltransferase
MNYQLSTNPTYMAFGFLKDLLPTPAVNFLRKVRAPYLARQYRRQQEQSDEFKKRQVFYSQFLHPGNLYFDIGANYGNRIGPILKLGVNRIVAVEPQPLCCDSLKRQFPGITVIQKGVGAAEAVKDFFISDNPVLSSFSTEFIARTENDRFRGTNWEKATPMELTTLDKLVKEYGMPDFIKVDVEGYEEEVFKGLTQKVKLLSFEYTLPELADKLFSIMEKLGSLGDCAFNYSVGESMAFELKDWMAYDPFLQLITSPEFVKTGFGDIYVRYT